MARVTGENFYGRVVYLVFFLYIPDGISVFRLLSIDPRHLFLILQGNDYCRKAQKDNKNIIVIFEKKGTSISF